MARVRVGLITDDDTLLDLAAAGIDRMQSLLERADLDEELARLTRAGLPQHWRDERAVDDAGRVAGGVGRRRDLSAGANRRGWSNPSSAPAPTTASTRRRAPRLFFKSMPEKVVSPGDAVGIRSDARWNVPEPELALVINSSATDRRLHHRQRHELARHRRREPAVPAAGEDLCTAPARSARGLSSARPKTTPVRGRFSSRFAVAEKQVFAGETRAGQIKRSIRGARRLPVPLAAVPQRRGPADRRRHRPARRVHARGGRPRADHDIGHRHARESRRGGLTQHGGDSMAVSRRRLLQLGLAPALLSRANAQVPDLAPTASRIYPGADGRLVYVPTTRATSSTTPRTPDTVAAASAFLPRRFEKPSGRSPATTRSTSRLRSTACRRVHAMRLASAAPCSCERAITGWRRRCGFRPAASCCAARAWATPAPS